MIQEKCKKVVEDALVSIYNTGYNEAIDDLCDIFYSYESPKLDPIVKGTLENIFRNCKKYK